MVRRKAVGLTLDLTQWLEGTPFVLDDHVVEIPVESQRIKREFTEEWEKDLYTGLCVFCLKPGAHYDHVNMFDKRACVSDLILQGAPREEVDAEVAKCQFVCRPCHGVISRFEMRCGFFTKKRRLNKMMRQGVDVSALIEKCSAEYAVAISGVYAALKERVGPKGRRAE